MTVEALPRVQHPQTYIGPEETTWRNRAFQIATHFGILLGSGLFIASFYTAIPWFVGVCVIALSVIALTYISNTDSSLVENVEKGNQCMVNFLLFLGASPNAIIKTGFFSSKSALIEAIENGHVAIAEDLIAAGADPEFALKKISLGTDIASIKLLLDGGANPNLFLNEACKKGKNAFVKELLNAGANPNPDIPFNPLMTAVHSEHEEIVQMLLANGADPTITPIPGYSAPLDLALEAQARLRTEDYLPVINDNDSRTREGRIAAVDRIVELLQTHTQPVEE